MGLTIATVMATVIATSLPDVTPEPLMSSPGYLISPGLPQSVAADGLSKDYHRIPSSNTTADTVLTWPIFQGRFPPEHLTNTLLTTNVRERDGKGANNDSFIINSAYEPLSDERIPYLINRFLRKVHTKNPILDVDALFGYGWRAAAHSPGWDAPSCLVP